MVSDDERRRSRPAWVPWMNEVDLLILEFLEEAARENPDPPALSVGVIYHNLVTLREESEKARSTFSRRCQRLASLGLIENTNAERAPYYRITESGRQYIRGEMPREDVPRLEE